MKEKIEYFKKILSTSYFDIVSSEEDRYFVLKKKNSHGYHELKKQILQQIKEGEAIDGKLFKEFMGLFTDVSDDVSNEYYKIHYEIVGIVFREVKEFDFSFERYSLESLIHRSVGNCFEKEIPKNLRGVTELQLRKKLFLCCLNTIHDYVQGIPSHLKKQNNFKEMSLYSMIIISGRIVMALGYDISRGKKADKTIEPNNTEIHHAFDKMTPKRIKQQKK